MSAAVSTEPLWQISGAQIRQGRRLWPPQPLTLTIPAGRVAVLGFSGAGKTSLLNLLVDFVAPERGTIRAPEKIAWVPQNHGLWMAHTVLEHLTVAGTPARDAQTLMEEFDLAERATSRADTLSIGEGARLAVARALAQNAPVLVMDEPLAHVDTARAGKYWRAIRERVARSGASVVFATHQPELALAEADYAICLRDGAVFYQGAVASLYERPETLELASFLGPGNWVTPEDAASWFGEQWTAARCIRPERLTLEETATGFPVIASRFMGSCAETELQHPEGPTRVFVHRPVSALPIGARVSIQVAPLA
jgi:iron(III) transport system ATP-binding protein